MVTRIGADAQRARKRSWGFVGHPDALFFVVTSDGEGTGYRHEKRHVMPRRRWWLSGIAAPANEMEVGNPALPNERHESKQGRAAATGELRRRRSSRAVPDVLNSSSASAQHSMSDAPKEALDAWLSPCLDRVWLRTP